jgi:hypothetical protein
MASESLLCHQPRETRAAKIRTMAVSTRSGSVRVDVAGVSAHPSGAGGVHAVWPTSWTGRERRGMASRALCDPRVIALQRDRKHAVVGLIGQEFSMLRVVTSAAVRTVNS